MQLNLHAASLTKVYLSKFRVGVIKKVRFIIKTTQRTNAKKTKKTPRNFKVMKMWQFYFKFKYEQHR